MAFLAGFMVAEAREEERQQQAENDAMHKAAAEKERDATDLTVAT